ncbi:diacylglycerol kinase family protein [Arundinibacter roseus]|uniref:Diacylglycerol kinase family protein n=1 Tax=Arundinibacter roseus TaxID=2070510 RepID=A0A4R4K9G4_9BACT|nr:diacylglycerol kinase family protein [Arundinibacter roseus]TDB64153.1 diacylglycerol kinase family protein [Arundinibacter roseus]
MTPPIQVRKALRSFRYAFQGIISLFQVENNARIHFVAAILAIILGFFLHISSLEWALIVTQIALVVAAEAFNTALEKLADVVSPEYHPLIKSVKDLAAGAVLIMAISAVVVGLLIFFPKLAQYFI